MTAINASRGAGTTPWQVVVRPGTFTENITTLKNVDIYGAGISTIINGSITNPIGGGPATLSDMLVIVPSTANILVEDALTIQNSQWFFTPSSTSIADCFRLTGAGVPSLTMFHCDISELPASPTTVNTGFYTISNVSGTTGATLDISECTGTQNGTAARIMAFNSITGIVNVSIRNSTFNLTIQDAGNASVPMFLYGGFTGPTGAAPNDLRWNIDNVNHLLINGSASNPVSPLVIALLQSFSFTPGIESCFCLRDSFFQYVDYASTVTNVYSANDIATAGNFIQLFDDKWIGLTLPSSGGSYVPQKYTGSNPILYEAVSASGGVSFSGGLQTGATVLTAVSAFTVTDANTIVVIPAPAAGTTVTLPSPTNSVYIGKWIILYNSSTVSGSITITSSPSTTGPANGTIITALQSRTFVNYDGTNWIVTAHFP